MSDYIYLLESHLTAEQNRLVSLWQEAATAANQNLYLAGGAMRDLLSGHPTRGLDFTLEGSPLAMARKIAGELRGSLAEVDELRETVRITLPSGLTVKAEMSREETYATPGSRPRVRAATIYDDLRRRDFTVNAIALGLNRGSKGLLRDPVNGLADLAARELRTTNPHAFGDDPSRLLRLVRFKHRLLFSVEERTARQFRNALDEHLERSIAPSVLLLELQRLGGEPSPSEVLRELESTGLLRLFSPELAGSKLNLAAVAKWEKLKRLLPLSSSGREGWRSLLAVLIEKLTPRERAQIYDTLEMSKSDTESGRKLQAGAKKLETALLSADLRKPSQIYRILSAVAPEEMLFTLYQSQQRLVLDRIRHYLQKYLPAAQEVTDAEVIAAGAAPGSKQFSKLREDLISARLDARPKKVEEVFVETPSGPVPRGRPAARV